MKGYFGLGQMSTDEKSNILDQHRQLYNGYRTMQPEVSNTQPLYVQDFAGDKNGITVNNKGEVKHYTNVGINEQVEKSKVCNECGGMMYEGECMECGGGMMNEDAECSECGGMMYEGECSECGYKGQMDEETGHLDDIYNQKDLNLKHGDFDYVEGGGNDYGTFEKMHHMKEQNGEVDELGTHELEKGKKYKYKSPSFDDEVEFDFEIDNEKKGDKMYKFKGKNAMNHLMAGKSVENFVDYLDLDEQGGNADDMDVDDVEPAFDFESEGPGMGDAYPVNEEGNMDEPEITYDTMESAFNDDEEEIDEQGISGVQGMYDEMDPAFDFDSKGPGSAGPYQRRNEDDDFDFDEDELEVDFDEFDPRDKSWEEITAHTGDDEFGGVDEDIKESLITQKNRIMEMMNRMNVIK